MSIKQPKVIYKEQLFEEFLKALEVEAAPHWVDIAHALGVHQNTIVAWKQRPEAVAAIQKGISFAMKKMQESGANDWRMWETKLKLLGLNPATKIEATIYDDPRKKILAKYGLGDDDAGQTENTEG